MEELKMLRDVKFINLNNFEESEHDVSARFGWNRKNLSIRGEIDGVKYEGAVLLKKGFKVDLPYYSNEAGRIRSDEHTFVEYDIFLWGDDSLQPDYEAVIYADLGKEDPSKPKPEKIYFIDNEQELKRYIDYLVW